MGQGAGRNGRRGNIWDFPGGIFGQEPLFNRPGTETTDRGQPAINRCRGRSLVLLAKRFPRAQVSFHHLRELERTQVSLFPPETKLCEIGSNRALGGWRFAHELRNEVAEELILI